MIQPHGFEIYIDIADNGYFLTMTDRRSEVTHSQVHMTAYKVGQAIEALLPRPPGQPVLRSKEGIDD